MTTSLFFLHLLRACLYLLSLGFLTGLLLLQLHAFHGVLEIPHIAHCQYLTVFLYKIAGLHGSVSSAEVSPIHADAQAGNHPRQLTPLNLTSS